MQRYIACTEITKSIEGRKSVCFCAGTMNFLCRLFVLCGASGLIHNPVLYIKIVTTLPSSMRSTLLFVMSGYTEAATIHL